MSYDPDEDIVQHCRKGPIKGYSLGRVVLSGASPGSRPSDLQVSEPEDGGVELTVRDMENIWKGRGLAALGLSTN